MKVTSSPANAKSAPIDAPCAPVPTKAILGPVSVFHVILVSFWHWQARSVAQLAGMSRGLFQGLRRRGVAGLDLNDQRFTSLLSPPLASLHTAGRDLGFECAELLMSLMNNRDQPESRFVDHLGRMVRCFEAAFGRTLDNAVCGGRRSPGS
jgi:hypothetical protein